MPVSIDKQKLIVNKNIVKGANTTWIEQDILVPDTKPDVMKIIRIDSKVYIGSKEVSDGSIKVSGQITYYIIYLAMDGNIRGINMTYPYVKVIEDKNVKKDMKLRMNAMVRNVIYSLPNERKISVKTEVVFKYKLSEIGEIEILNRINDCEGLECKMSKDSFFNVLEYKMEMIEANEDVMLPEAMPGVNEILRVSNEIVNTEYKISYNKILVKGDVKTNIVYTSSDDSGEIYSYDVNLPFTGMIEFSNISDNSKFDIQYTLKSVDISLDTSNEPYRMINMSAEVVADVLMYEEKEIEYIEDFYSMEENLNYDKYGISIVKNKENIEKIISVKDNIGNVPDISRLLDYTVDISNLNTKISGSNVYINGNIKINTMYQIGKDKKTESKTYDMLVDETMSMSKDVEEKYVTVNMDVTKAIVRLDNDNIMADVEIMVKVDVDNVESINQINDIKEEKVDFSQFDSMNIYIVKKGDNLWNIAKKYKTSVAKIANTNDIVDSNKLDIGQKLLIIR